MSAIAIIAVIVAGLCTTAFNWHFSYALGRTEHEALTWGVFSVALDVAKWTMLIVAVRAWPSPNSVAAFVIWLAATSFSFMSALGFASANSFHQLVIAQQFRDNRATIEAAKQSPLWKSTHACTQLRTKQARDYCTALNNLEAPNRNQPKEAPATILVTIFKLSPATANVVLSVYLALVCELISALGLFAVARLNSNPSRQHQCNRRTSQTTPPSSSNAENSTLNSPSSGAKPSMRSNKEFWRKHRSWK